jgi:general secretion pathway protein A
MPASIILSKFGRPASGKNKGELLLDLGHFVISRESKKLTTVLIVDEAHHL